MNAKTGAHLPPSITPKVNDWILSGTILLTFDSVEEILLWPLKWNLFVCTFKWCCFCFGICLKEICNFCLILTLASSGVKELKRGTFTLSVPSNVWVYSLPKVNPHINMDILHTVLHTFPVVLLGRVSSTIKTRSLIDHLLLTTCLFIWAVLLKGEIEIGHSKG